MKRVYALLIALCLSGSLFALDNKYEQYFSFRITPQLEMANGVIKEYVFDSSCKNTDNKESELDWNIKTISLFNLHADFNILRYLSIGLSGTFGVQQRTDFMQDYDWLNSVGNTEGHPEWMTQDPTEQTNFSEHINQLDKLVNFKVALGGNIFLPAEIKLTPHLEYIYEFIRFSAFNGYREYKSENYVRQSFSGKVISYEQKMHSFLLGLNMEIDCIPKTCLLLNFDLSPKLTFLNATDFHYQKNIAFLDSFKNLLLLESGLTAQYCFTKNHSAGICGKLQYIPLSKGNSFKKSIDSNGNFTSGTWIQIGKDSGGTERFIWSLGLNYSFSL